MPLYRAFQRSGLSPLWMAPEESIMMIIIIIHFNYKHLLKHWKTLYSKWFKKKQTTDEITIQKLTRTGHDIQVETESIISDVWWKGVSDAWNRAAEGSRSNGLSMQEGVVMWSSFSLQLALCQSSDTFSTSSKTCASAQIITAPLWLKWMNKT